MSRTATERPTAPPSTNTVRVPFRLCFVGEHVEHQGGSALAVNLDRGVDLTFESLAEGLIEIENAENGEVVRIRRGEPLLRRGDWTDHVKAILQQFCARDTFRTGFRARLERDASGTGFGASTAIEMAYALAIMECNIIRLPRDDLAGLVALAERAFVRSNPDAGDALTLLRADGSTAVRISDHGRKSETFGWPAGVKPPRLALVHAPDWTEGLYDEEQVSECRAAAMTLDPAVARLHDVPVARRGLDRLPPLSARRARHVFEEEMRVRAATSAWARGDLLTVGRAMTASGESAFADFDLGPARLVELGRRLREIPGVAGTRVVGDRDSTAVFVLLEPGTADTLSPGLDAWRRENPDVGAHVRVEYPGYGAAAGRDSIYLKG